MQKKIIALAIAAASTAAFAQTNVTIYGVADASFESIRANGASANAAGAADTAQNLVSRNRIVSNSSYIGFKGVEDLGNGLKALFQIETQLALDNANDATAGTRANSLANRDSFVGLTGGFGTVVAGYVSTPHRNLGAGWDVMPGATGAAGNNGLLGKINTGVSAAANGTTTNVFTNNTNTIFRSQAVAYITPTVSGLSGVIAYVPNETKTSLANNAAAGTAQLNPSAWNLAVNYANGPLKAGYSYLAFSDNMGAAAVAGNLLGVNTGSKLTSHLLVASYQLGDLTLGAAYNQNKQTIDGAAANAASGIKNSVWALEAKYSIGKTDLAAMYQRASNGSVEVNGTNAAVTADNRGATMYGVRAGYNLSKRTQAYALYTRINNKANGNYDFGAGTGASTVGGTAALSAGADPQAFGIGLRHSF